MLIAFYRLMAKLYHLVDDYQYRARVRVLLNRGLVMGKNVTIARTAILDASYPYLIRIGDNCSIADQVRIWTHDAATFKFTGGYARLGKVEIKDNCFIGDRSTILPGVTIGPNALVSAGSVVNKDVPPNSCVAGVPARVYARFDEYLERNQQQIEHGELFDFADLVGRLDDLDGKTRAQIWDCVQDGRHVYVKGRPGKNIYTWNVA